MIVYKYVFKYLSIYITDYRMFKTININDKDIMDTVNTVELAYITYDGFDDFEVPSDTDNDNDILNIIPHPSDQFEKYYRIKNNLYLML